MFTKILYLFSDGGVRLEPPAASSAVVVKNERGQVLDWSSRLLPAMTNNEAEYCGLLDALTLTIRLKPNVALFHLDSQIVVGQVAGSFMVRDTKLKPLHAKAKAQIARLAELKIQSEFFFIPREFNLLADALASDALLLHPERVRKNFNQMRKETNP